MFVLRACLILITLLIVSQSAVADWATVTSSPEAGIDSLERVLTITDYKDSTFLGRVLIAVGDVNGDGAADLIAGRMRVLNPFQDDSLFLFYGGAGADGVADAVYDLDVLTGGPTNPGAKYEIGDINGDGYVDIGISRGVSPVCEFHLWNHGFSDPPDFSIPGLWSAIPIPGDILGNGGIDVALSRDRWGLGGNTVFLFDLNLPFDTVPEHSIEDTTDRFGSNIGIGDANGDSIPDLIVSTRLRESPDTSITKFYWGGPTFDTIADFVIERSGAYHGEIILPVGDINVDGFDDMFISSHQTYGVYFGGPAFDSTIDIPTNAGPAHANDVDARGDFNNDGYNDLLIGINNTNGGIEQIYIYLGGPEMDSIPDIFMNSADIPGLQVNIGLSVVAIGDFTHDGIDDFAVHSRTSSGGNWRSEVNIFAGWDGVTTNVPYDYEPILPSGYELSQNYPNPFNPSTTIQFALPKSGQTELVVYNILGERVTTLINRRLAAGSYTIEWDGTNTQGEPVASGVYVYRLQSGDYTTSRKMVLAR